MIKYKDTILENFFIDPVTAIITNSKGEIQKTSIHQGYAIFKNMAIHVIQAHTHYGYKEGYDVHHLDENKMNNTLSNLVYLTRGEHMKIHFKGKQLTNEHKQKISDSLKGNKNMYGKQHSSEAKQKMSEAKKGRTTWIKGKHLSEETKRMISAGHKGKHHSEETKQKMSEKRKGKIWINNGVIQKLVKSNDIPEGFVRGRLK